MANSRLVNTQISISGRIKLKFICLLTLMFNPFSFEYVKQFEQIDNLLPNTWIVIRVDGRGFTK